MSFISPLWQSTTTFSRITSKIHQIAWAIAFRFIGSVNSTSEKIFFLFCRVLSWKMSSVTMRNTKKKTKTENITNKMVCVIVPLLVWRLSLVRYYVIESNIRWDSFRPANKVGEENERRREREECLFVRITLDDQILLFVGKDHQPDVKLFLSLFYLTNMPTSIGLFTNIVLDAKANIIFNFVHLSLQNVSFLVCSAFTIIRDILPEHSKRSSFHCIRLFCSIESHKSQQFFLFI